MTPVRQPVLMTTTLWDFPSQQYGDESQGSTEFAGATPAYIVWNLLQRYTQANDLVVDPMAGSGTTLDVARELGRRALGYDVHPTRADIFRCDARKLPLEDGKADFVFVDPPYSTHLDYGPDPRDIGKLEAEGGGYYEAMDQVIAEMARVLHPGGHCALYVSDSWRNGKPFSPIGFEVFERLRRHFEPVDIVAVVRHNKSLARADYHAAAAEGNFFLRGFNYLFILRKPEVAPNRPDAVPRKTEATTPRQTDGAPRPPTTGSRRPAYASRKPEKPQQLGEKKQAPRKHGR
jgi:SAM-dependent methyltransferase